MTPDSNLLVSAYRADHPHHLVARQWLQDTLTQAASGRTSLLLWDMVVVGFMRSTTDPQVFHQADTLLEASGFVDHLLSRPGVQYQHQGPTWPHLQQRCLALPPGGHGLGHAWLAAAVLQSGETLCTFDPCFQPLLPSEQLILLKT